MDSGGFAEVHEVEMRQHQTDLGELAVRIARLRDHGLEFRERDRRDEPLLDRQRIDAGGDLFEAAPLVDQRGQGIRVEQIARHRDRVRRRAAGSFSALSARRSVQAGWSRSAISIGPSALSKAIGGPVARLPAPLPRRVRSEHPQHDAKAALDGLGFLARQRR
jgi:hypothetical protein